MAHRSARLGLSGVAFIAGISVHYEGHAAARKIDPIGILFLTHSGRNAGDTHAGSCEAERPGPTVKPVRKATIRNPVVPSLCWDLPVTTRFMSAGITDVVRLDNIDRRLPITIEHLRLEPAPDADIVPSSNVAFDLVNTGSTSITDIMFEVCIVSQPVRHFEPEGIRAGPYRLRTKFVLHPGYTMSFEIRLLNLSADCNCAPNARVISARSID
jgi:hypothetical protein